MTRSFRFRLTLLYLGLFAVLFVCGTSYAIERFPEARRRELLRATRPTNG